MKKAQLTKLIMDNLVLQDIEEHDTESGSFCNTVIFKAKCEKYGIGKNEDISIEGYFTIVFTEKGEKREFFSFDVDSFGIFDEAGEIFNYDEKKIYNELYNMAKNN